jgi:hypothetical protein
VHIGGDTSKGESSELEPIGVNGSSVAIEPRGADVTGIGIDQILEVDKLGVNLILEYISVRGTLVLKDSGSLSVVTGYISLESGDVG